MVAFDRLKQNKTKQVAGKLYMSSIKSIAVTILYEFA